MNILILILLIISLIVIGSYLGYVTLKYGVQESISDTYYTLGRPSWFTLVIWGMILPLLIAGMIAGGSGFLFFAGAAIMFVGAAPAFKLEESIESKVHIIATYIGAGLGSLSVIFDFKWWFLGIPFIVTSLLLLTDILKLKNKIFWIEISAYIMLFLTILFS